MMKIATKETFDKFHAALITHDLIEVLGAKFYVETIDWSRDYVGHYGFANLVEMVEIKQPISNKKAGLSKKKMDELLNVVAKEFGLHRIEKDLP